MSRRTRLPHCFYCDGVTSGALSRIDGATPVCTNCAYAETIDPQSACDRWLSLGGDRAAAFVFAESFNTRGRVFPVHVAAAQPQIGGAR